MKSSYFCKIGICKGGNSYLLRQTMSQGHIRIRPSRPSVGRSRDIFMRCLPQSSFTARGRKPYVSKTPSACWKASVPPLQKSCATLIKQQVMATDESADTKIYGRVCLAWTCRTSCTSSASVGLNQVFLLSSMDRLTVKNCHNLLFRQGSQDSL